MPEASKANPTVELPGGSANNRSQDAFEELKELLRRIEVFPPQMRVSWADSPDTPDAPITIGALSLGDVQRINRAIMAGLQRNVPVNLLEERPHEPMMGETVLDTGTNEIGEVTGYVLRPLEAGRLWTAEPDNIARPPRDRLIRARMAQYSRGQRATAPAMLEPAQAERVTA
ncbi:hypothetical protein ACWD25_56290 [Streptomyces sp. NPDC002920]